MEPVQPDGLGRLHVHGRGERGGQERRHAAGDHRARGQPRMLLRHQVRHRVQDVCRPPLRAAPRLPPLPGQDGGERRRVLLRSQYG